MENFEQASRLQLRFDTAKGPLSAEDLWHLPLTSATGKVNLDDIARELDAKLKTTSTVSFVDKPAKPDLTTQLGFDIVKRVIDVRLEERDAAATAEANKQKKQKLLAILEAKENEGLSQLSMEDLRAQINAL